MLARWRDPFPPVDCSEYVAFRQGQTVQASVKQVSHYQDGPKESQTCGHSRHAERACNWRRRGS